MLSPEQKDNLRLGWRNCPACEKKMIMAEFIREYGSDPGWDEWLLFLGRRLNLEELVTTRNRQDLALQNQ